MEGKTLTNLGNVYQLQGRWEEAIANYKKALEICRALGDRQGEGKTLTNMCFLYERQGDREKACALWQEAPSKLHPDSPVYRTVQGWVKGKCSRR
jgi:tetratricopeptide (TPR) repeat protein